ncbi:MAG: HU family DNA-binding protein [Gemmataceae bacterium]
MTKKEIVKQISDETGLTQLEVKNVVQMTFDSIIETLATNGRIELRKFGVFEVKRRKARRARNPRTNQPVDVEAKNVVTFQPGKDMEEKVRNTTPVSGPRLVIDDEDDADESAELTVPQEVPATIPFPQPTQPTP